MIQTKTEAKKHLKDKGFPAGKYFVTTDGQVFKDRNFAGNHIVKHPRYKIIEAELEKAPAKEPAKKEDSEPKKTESSTEKKSTSPKSSGKKKSSKKSTTKTKKD